MRPDQGGVTSLGEETKPEGIGNIQANLGGRRSRDLLMSVRDLRLQTRARRSLATHARVQRGQNLRIISALLGGGSSKLRTASRRAVQALKVAWSTPSRSAIKATGIRALSRSASSSNWAVVGVNDISYLWRHTRPGAPCRRFAWLGLRHGAYAGSLAPNVPREPTRRCHLSLQGSNSSLLKHHGIVRKNFKIQ